MALCVTQRLGIPVVAHGLPTFSIVIRRGRESRYIYSRE